MHSDRTALAALLSLCLLLGACDSNESGIDNFLQATEVAGLGISEVEVTLTATLVNAGQTLQATASGEADGGEIVDLTDTVSWTSSDEGVATINDAGRVTAVADGAATLTATLAGLRASAALTVRTADLTALQLDVASEIDECRTTALAGTGTYSDGSTRALLDSPSWSSSDTNLARIDTVGATQELIMHNAGTVTVTATLDGVSASQDVTILDTLSEISIAPQDATVAVESTQQYVATGSWTTGQTADISAATRWSTADATVASFSASQTGRLTANDEGSTTVSANCGGLTVTTGMTAEDLTVDSVYIYSNSTNRITLDVGDNGYQLELYAVYSDGSTEVVTDDADWSVLSPGSLFISVGDGDANKGVLTISGTDTVYVEAEFDGFIDDILVVVE